MATFRGIIEAPKLTPVPCGILSVADVTRHTDGDFSWVRGFVHEFATQGNITNWTPYTYNSTPVAPASKATVASGPAGSDSVLALPVSTFNIEVESKFTGLDSHARDYEKIALEQLEAATQKALELELSKGAAARDANAAGSSNTPYFSRATTGAAPFATVVGTGTVTPTYALALLEQAIADQSNLGLEGVIHITRDVASILLGGSISYQPNDQGDGECLRTNLGTRVIVGSGYDGTGPGDAAPSATKRWMYATGDVFVHLGTPEVSKSFDSAKNNTKIKVSRPAAVYFDPDVFSAVEVTLP